MNDADGFFMDTQLVKVAVTAIMVTAGGDGGDVTMIALSATFANERAIRIIQGVRPPWATYHQVHALDGSTLLKIPETSTRTD